MSRYLLYLAVILTAAALINVPGTFAQNEEPKTAAKGSEPQAAASQAAVTTGPATVPVVDSAPKMSELSIYGEVQAVNMQANSMTIQYYDYDNDEEKTTEISLDAGSKLENAKAIGDIKKGDWVDVTYTASAGKNTAKFVSVEKEEPAQEESAPAAEE